MIYLLRHGQDDENYIGGWSDIGLTEYGRQEINEVCAVLEKLPINKIISSDIVRAKETADIVGGKLNLPVTYSSELRELDKGLLTGLLKSDAEIRYPDYVDFDIYKKYPKGESMLDFYMRIKRLLPRIKNLNNTLIVTHRGVINMIYFLMANQLPNMDKEQFNVTHASVHEWNQEKQKIRRLKKWEN